MSVGIGVLSMALIWVLWLVLPLWSRRATSVHQMLRRLCLSFAIPVLGMTVLVLVLHRSDAWPLLLAIAVAAALAAAALLGVRATGSTAP